MRVHGGASLGTASGQFEATVSGNDETVVSQAFLILNINIRCLFFNRDELCQHPKDISSHLALFQESSLNSSFVFFLCLDII